MRSLIGFGSVLLLLSASTAGCFDDLTVGGDDAGSTVDGGSGAESCATSADCSSGETCAFAEADTCAATGECVAKSPGPICGAITYGCACDGSEVELGCTGLPDGYVSKPFAHEGACAADAGKGSECTTTADCPTDEICGYAVADGCGAKGQCVAEPTGAEPCVESEGCACDGTTIGVGGCGAGVLPAGYTSKPLAHENACVIDAGSSDGGTCVDVPLATFDTSCTAASDCTLVRTGNICNGQCSCGDTPINQSGLAQWQTDTSDLSLEACPCAFPGTPQCIAGQCTLCTGQPGQSAGCGDGG